MPNKNGKLKYNKKWAAKFPDLCEKFTEAQLDAIGNRCIMDSDADFEAIAAHHKKVSKWTKTFYIEPEIQNKDGSNVVLPTVTIACIQFAARACDAVLGTKEIVKASLYKHTSEASEAAERLAKFTNWEKNVRDVDFKAGFRQSMTEIPLNGTVYRKCYYDPFLEYVRGKQVDYCSIAVDPASTNIHEARRISEKILIYKNDIQLLIQNGFFRDVLTDTESNFRNDGGFKSATKPEGTGSSSANEAQGVDDPISEIDTPYEIIEQHRYLDFSAKPYENTNGEEEEEIDWQTTKPVIVWIESSTKKVLRIVSRENKLRNNKPITFYTKYLFLPAISGQQHGVGFGLLLDGSGAAIDTGINQLIDAGFLANTQTGFYNRELGTRQKDIEMERGKFIPVNIPQGESLGNYIMPFKFAEPSSVLFQLITFLTSYNDRVTTVSEMFTGEMPSSDTGSIAVTSLLEQGLKLFSSVYLSIHESLQRELAIHTELGELYFDADTYAEIVSDDLSAFAVADYKDDYKESHRIVLVSDPAISTKAEALQKADAIYAAIKDNPVSQGNPILMLESLKQRIKAMEYDDSKLQGILEEIDRMISVAKIQVEGQMKSIKQQQAMEDQSQMQQPQPMAGMAGPMMQQQIMNQQVQEPSVQEVSPDSLPLEEEGDELE